MKKLKLFVALALALLAGLSTHRISAQGEKKSKERYREWRSFGGGPDNIHYSRLSQITRKNVSQLKVAWQYDTGDMFAGSEMQCNPIIIDGLIYVTTPKLRVVALEACVGGQSSRLLDPVAASSATTRSFGVVT